MSHNTHAHKDCFYLAHDGVDTFHYGEIKKDMEITTALPNLEWFDTKEEMETRLEELGGTPLTEEEIQARIEELG